MAQSRRARTSPRLSLRVRKQLSDLNRVRDRVELFWREAQLPHDAGLQVLLSIEEALSNIIRHAAPGGATSRITLELNVAHGEARVLIEDNALPFDPLSHPPPQLDASLTERRGGGLGIFLIRHLMDEVSYSRTEERNCLRMTKRIHLPHPGTI